jgi:hypothetical protein
MALVKDVPDMARFRCALIEVMLVLIVEATVCVSFADGRGGRAGKRQMLRISRNWRLRRYGSWASKDALLTHALGIAQIENGNHAAKVQTRKNGQKNRAFLSAQT